MEKKLKIAVLAALIAVSVGCAAPSRIVPLALHHSEPGIAGPTGPYEMTFMQSDTVSSTRTDRTSRDRKSSPGKAAPVQKSVDKKPKKKAAVQVAAVPPSAMMVPASGDVRERLARSALRLVGIRKSFDSRSFTGHLLAICDLLPRHSSSMAQTTNDVIGRARKAGKFRKKGAALAVGDLVFFKCGSSCGADASDGIGSGVVVSVEKGKIVYVAYVNGVVRKKNGTGQLTGSSAP